MDRPLIQIDDAVRPMNDDEYAEWLASEPQRNADAAASVRSERNRLLADSDWTQLPDSPVDSQAWGTYRQNLRDITDQAGFPLDVTWPQKP